MKIRGKCNCGQKAKSEWIVQQKGIAWSMKFCDNCKPKKQQSFAVKIYG